MILWSFRFILRAQQLDLIYSQSGILYEIIPDALRPMHNVEKLNPVPHANGVVGSMKSPTVDSLVKQLHELFNKHSTMEVAKATPSLQNANVFAQSSQKGNQHPGGKNNKGKNGGKNKINQNPLITPRGVRNIRRRLIFLASCSKETILLINAP